MTATQPYNVIIDSDRCVTLTDYNVDVLFGTYNDKYYIWVTRGLANRIASESTECSRAGRNKRGRVNKAKLRVDHNYEFAIMVRKDDTQSYELLKENAVNIIGMMVNIHFIDEFNFMTHINTFGCASMEINKHGVENCLITKLTGGLKKIVSDDREVCIISHIHNAEVDGLLNNKISHKELLRTSIEKNINYLIYDINRTVIY